MKGNVTAHRILFTRALTAAWLVASAAGAAGDPDAGRSKAEVCLMCHAAASFAGQDEAAIEARIQAIAASDQPHPPLDLSAEDIRDVAAFYARGE
jgi:cytochrome c553